MLQWTSIHYTELRVANKVPASGDFDILMHVRAFWSLQNLRRFHPTPFPHDPFQAGEAHLTRAEVFVPVDPLAERNFRIVEARAKIRSVPNHFSVRATYSLTHLRPYIVTRCVEVCGIQTRSEAVAASDTLG